MPGFGGAVGGDLLSLGLGIAASEGQMHEQMRFDENMYKRRYRMSVDDLKAAKLNPMLAVGGLSASSPSIRGGRAAPDSDIGGTVIKAKLANEQIKNLQADSELKAASAKEMAGRTLSPGVADQVATGQAGLSVSSAKQADAMVGSINLSYDKIKAEVDNLRSEIAKRGVDTETAKKLQDLTVEHQKLLNRMKAAEIPVQQVKGRAGQLILDDWDEAAKGNTIFGAIVRKAKDVEQSVRDMWRNFQQPKGELRVKKRSK